MSAAVSVHPIPDVALVRELFGMLFDGLMVKLGPKLDTSPKSNGFFGVYVARDGTPAGLCGCDFAFAANSGAALSMLPPNIAKEAIKDKALTDVMTANLNEVMNICTRLLLNDASPHVKLREICTVSKLPAAAAAILSAPKARVDFEVGLGKYGSGILCVLCL